MRREGGGTQAEGAEWHAGDRGEGEDAKEREGAGAEQGQAAVERGGHGQQRVGDDPEAERHPVRDRGSAPVSRVPWPGLQEAQGNPGEAGSCALAMAGIPLVFEDRQRILPTRLQFQPAAPEAALSGSHSPCPLPTHHTLTTALLQHSVLPGDTGGTARKGCWV